jgi:diguanylate cyclase (GGDEF)-like protein/PAS domain S-box-containing protein
MGGIPTPRLARLVALAGLLCCAGVFAVYVGAERDIAAALIGVLEPTARADALRLIHDAESSARVFRVVVVALGVALGLTLLWAGRSAERSVREMEDRLAQVVEHADEGICVVEEEWIRLANAKAAELTGFTVEELVGRSCLDIVAPEDRDLVREVGDKRFERRDFGPRRSFRLLTKHQGVRWFDVNALVFAWQGRPAALLFLADVTEHRQMAEEIRQLALHDALTLLPNRRLLLEHLATTVARNKRHGTHAAVILIDLDRFKPLNDTHGHAAGDQLLVEVGRRLRACVRDGDTVARLGGDEFVVLLTDLSVDPSAALAEADEVTARIVARLGATYDLELELGGQKVTVQHSCTASAGLHLFAVHEGDVEALLVPADAAMYRAKNAGRTSAS